MSRNKEGHGVVTDDKGQEQPVDKDRAQTALTLLRELGPGS